MYSRPLNRWAACLLWAVVLAAAAPSELRLFAGGSPLNYQPRPELGGFGFSAGVEGVQGNALWLARFTYAREWPPLPGPAGTGPRRDPRQNDFGLALSFGLPWGTPDRHLAFMTGLGLYGGVRRGRFIRDDEGTAFFYEKDLFLEPGIPLELRLAFPYMAIEPYFILKPRSQLGVSFTLRLGNLLP